MRTLPAALAPAVLVGGWGVAGLRQPAAYHPWTDTISALAGRGAHDRWIMTSAFILLGLCHLASAAVLRAPILALGGMATAALAAAPEPVEGSSSVHAVLAGIALIALAVWSVSSHRRATAVLMVLLTWFGVALHYDALVGLSERVVTAAEALWPLIVIRAAPASHSPAR